MMEQNIVLAFAVIIITFMYVLGAPLAYLTTQTALFLVNGGL
jgi:hypothetical protein